MKKGILFVFTAFVISFIFFSCGIDTYRYSYIRPSEKKLNLKTYSINSVEVFNAESLFLDKNVVSNTISQVFDIVMANNGFSSVKDGDISVDIKLFVEENDVINNKQTLSLFLTINDKNSPLAQFILASKSKDLILDKSMLIREINSVADQIKLL